MQPLLSYVVGYYPQLANNCKQANKKRLSSTETLSMQREDPIPMTSGKARVSDCAACCRGDMS